MSVSIPFARSPSPALTRNPRSATLMGLKLCVLRARRVRGLATSGSGLTAYRRLVGIEGLLVLTLFGLRPDLDEHH